MINRRELVSAGVAAALAASKADAFLSLGGSTAGQGFFPAGHWQAAVVPFTNTSGQVNAVIYPRPDTETATYARHRWMYYDGTHTFVNRIPICVRGGAFPYVYQIISAPAGTTMGATYWQSGWTQAQALAAGYGDLLCSPTGSFSNQTFWIRVTGQDLNYVDVIFTASTVGGYQYNSVTPSSSYGFIFLDPVSGVDGTSYPSTTGLISTIAAPYRTLNWVFGATTGAKTYPSSTLVIRGTGSTPIYAPDANYGIELIADAGPVSIIGMEGDASQASLDLTNAALTRAFDANASDTVIGNVAMTGGPCPSAYNGSNSGASAANFSQIKTSNLIYRTLLYLVNCPNVCAGENPTDNCSILEMDDPDTGSSTVRNYVWLKGVTETNRLNGANTFGIFDWYKIQYGGAELCSCTGNAAPYAFFQKASVSDTTIRCNVSIGIGIQTFDQWNAAPSQNREICYNIADGSSQSSTSVQINYSYSARTVASVAAALSTTGGSLANTTYYYVVTNVLANGETVASAEVSVTTTPSDPSVTLTVTGAQGTGGTVNLYRGTTPGGENVYYNLGAIGGSNQIVYTDTGLTPTGSASPPVTSTAQTFGTTWIYRNSLVGQGDVNLPNSPVANGPVYFANNAIQYGSATAPVYIDRAAGSLPENVTNTGTNCQASSGVFTGSYALTDTYIAYAGLIGASIQ